LSYLSCRLTRFLILLRKPSQHTTRKVYTFVPVQKWTKKWTDEDLYSKYGLTNSEIAFIEKVVRPMDLSGTPFRALASGEVMKTATRYILEAASCVALVLLASIASIPILIAWLFEWAYYE